MRLVEIKDINGLINQIKTDIEALANIEVKNGEDIKELKKKLSELKTAKKVMESLNQPTDVIDKQIKEIEAEINKKEVKLTDKQKALLKLLELYGIKTNIPKKGGNTGKKEIIISDKDKIIGRFTTFAECCRHFGLNIGGDSPKRVLERFLKKECPKIRIRVNNEIFYDGIKE